MGTLKDSVREHFVYECGKLFRVKGSGEAGSVEPSGYVRVSWKSRRYRLHQLIYMYHHGEVPAGMCIDHIDGNVRNNRIENLRAVSYQGNRFNSAQRANNTSGCPNVSWVKQKSKWLVYLTVKGKKFYFGLYDDYELAELVSQEARRKYHAEYLHSSEKELHGKP